jgi:hypothetical protein
MSKTRAAAITLQRPPEPITTSSLLAALQPLADVLGLPELDDVLSIHLSESKVAVTVIPRHRGRRQHDSRLRVVYPVVYDGEGSDDA